MKDVRDFQSSGCLNVFVISFWVVLVLLLPSRLSMPRASLPGTSFTNFASIAFEGGDVFASHAGKSFTLGIL